MKQFILFIVMLFAFSFQMEAQKIWTLTSSGDTIVNSASKTVSIPMVSGYNSAMFGVRVVKLLGTVDGIAFLEHSSNNLDWETVPGTDTLNLDNVTTNFKNWIITSPPAPHYRIKATGSGTMTARLYGYLHTKKY